MIKVNETKFRSGYADANPEWLVTEKRGRGTWIATVIDCPDYAGVQQAFTSQQIEASIGWSKSIRRSTDESAEFFANLTVGSFVHYHNHGNYVRCQVTADHQLLPIALVGEWKGYDLPRRMDDGKIYNGYHVDSIKNKKAFQPHASHIYEFNLGQRISARPCSFNNWPNPATLLPVNFEVPPMTVEQEAKAALVRTVNDIQAICGNNGITPDGKLHMIRNILDPKAL